MRDPFGLLGTAIENRYRIDAVIGEGGFGVVYRGHHLRLEHPVAIKCLKIPSHFTPEAKEIFLKRFREEGKILLKLADAAGVPRIYDYGDHIGGAEVPYLVIEWLDGQTLEEMLVSRRASRMTGLRGGDAIALMLPAVEALAIAHRSQIAHRDIKPANLFLSSGPRGPVVKVLDFGIAKAMQEGESVTQSQTQTATSFRAFTPNYAAPEQFAPKRYGASGPWTDVHALGLLLVELLTDQIANKGDDFVECLESATSEERPSPRGRGAQISNELEALVLKAVARAPDARYPDAGALAAAMRETPEFREGSSNALMTMVPATKVPTVPTPPLPAAQSVIEVPNRADGTAMRPVIASARTEMAPPEFSSLPGGDRVSSGTQIGNAIFERAAVTHQGVAHTQSRPRPPKKSSSLPLVLGALVVVGGGAGALLWARGGGDGDGNGHEDGRDDGPPKVSSTKVEKDAALTVKWAWNNAEARELMPTVETTEAEAKGKVHSRLRYEGGRVTLIEEYDPAGTVQKTIAVKYPSDGGWEYTTVDGRGIIIHTIRMSKTGIRTKVSRSGSPFTDGCARHQVKFNPAGDVLEQTCQDTEGHVIIDAQGCQTLAFEMNAHHQVVTQRCLLEGGKPVLNSNGIHMYRVVYDAKGQLTELSHFGVDGTAITDAGGCARVRNEFDTAGNKTFEQCIGASGLPVAFRGSNISGTRHAFDEHGCEVRREFADVDGRPASLGTIAATVMTHDKHCSVLSSESLDAKGSLTSQSPGGVARNEYLLHDNGNITQQSCFDAKRVPTHCGGEAVKEGSVIRYQYDDQGREISTKAFDSTGAPTKNSRNYPHENRSRYDAFGLLLESRYLDEKGQPAPALGDVARRALRYDALGSEISVRMYGADDKPVVGVTGAHEIRTSYDDKHRRARMELRENDGSYAAKPTIVIGGVSWPAKAVRMEIIREETRLLNRFFDRDEKEVKTIDCTALEKTCHR